MPSRILDRDMLREDTHCDLMRLLVRGECALALRQFERCRDALRRELAIQPMRESSCCTSRSPSMRLGTMLGRDEPWPASPAMDVAYSSSRAILRRLRAIAAARRHLTLADEQLQRAFRHTALTTAAPRVSAVSRL